MPPGDAITGPGQYQLRTLVMGRGTPFPVNGFEGLGLPGVTATDLSRGDSDGVWYGGPDRVEPRRVILEVGTYDGGGADLDARVSSLLAAWAPVRSGTVDLAARLDGWDEVRYLTGRPRRVGMRDAEGAWRMGQAGGIVAEFFAGDPAWYGLTEQAQGITIATSATSAQGTVTNAGNFRSLPRVTFSGPTRNPRLTNAADDGRAMRIDLDVNAGQELVVDFAQRTVTLDGVDRYDAVRSDHEWWELLAGSNTLTYSRSSTGLTGSASTATVYWRHAWLG